MKNNLPRLAARCLALAAMISPLGGHAADEPPDDAGALELADRTPEAAASTSPWRVYGEAAAGRTWLRAGSDTVDGVRGSLDLRYDGRPAQGLRAVLSNRLDWLRDDGVERERKVNALREAYVSWQARPDLNADIGRINLRQGSAWGYNPTDFFRDGALRSVVSPDPAMLRENRLGTVAAQVQKVWSDTSLSFAVSPKLASTPSDDPFSLDLGSTNNRHRWLLSASHRLGKTLNPQWLLHGGQSTPTQLGLNLSTLLNDATVGFIEFSTGKRRTLVDETLQRPGEKSWQQRVAAGATYTTAFNLSFTAEFDYNSAGMNRAEWDALLAGPAVDTARVLQTALRMQDLPVRRSAFFYATWRDALVPRLDLSGFVRVDLLKHSREHWLETRYHWGRADVALQWHLNSGDPDSLFGLTPRRRDVEVSLRYYF
jgi:hypothetical protein